MKKWILAGSLVVFAWCVLAEVTISNLVVAQRPGTKLMDITYDVSSTTTDKVWISLTVSNGAAAVDAINLTGDIGWPVATGTNKSIVWNGGTDWNGNSATLTYALKADETPPPPQGAVQISAGINSGTDPDFGAYSLTNASPFYMDATEVTKAQWDAVRTWALTNGYSFDNTGSGKATNHPVHTVNWYDCVKWCNARSEKDARTPVYSIPDQSVYRSGRPSSHTDVVQNTSVNGYRLPTVVEWEYAARGGQTGKRFPWGDTIQHTRANYNSSSSYSYDTSSTRGYHPSAETTSPRTMAVKSFAANGYGLYDMAGNVWEWCWDTSGTSRFIRGGSWFDYASHARCGDAGWRSPGGANYGRGFRAVCR